LPERVPEDVARCVYRIAREALHNVVRHSRAPSAIVALAIIDNDNVLTVIDDGVGFRAIAILRTGASAPTIGFHVPNCLCTGSA
jgi:signal transduction histidine kinase